MSAGSVLVCVGDELLAGVTVNTNASMIGDTMISAGLPVLWSLTVGDELPDIVDALERACAAASVVIVTGGLGPTQDDKTRDAIALLLGTELERHEDIVEDIRVRFRSFGRDMPPSNARQADIPKGATPILNPWGTAPGIRAEHKGAVLFCIPGVPGEARRMINEQILPELAERGDASVIRAREIQCVGISESGLSEKFPDIAVAENPRMAFLPGGGEIKLRFVARGTTADECEALLDEAERIVQERAGEFVYAVGNEPLEAVIGQILSRSGRTVATAESCTAGLLSSRIASIPGSSEYFVGGVITYTADMKVSELDVPREMIEQKGLVSEAVAEAMAVGARRRFNTDFALAITCAAGPEPHDGAEPGTMCLGFAGRGFSEGRWARVPGDRDQVRTFATTFALNLLRAHLAEGQ